MLETTEIYITRINLPIEYDVHFGKSLSASKIQAMFSVASVRPKNEWRKPFKILIAVPKIYCGQDKGRKLAADVLNLFLDDGDMYEVASIAYRDSEELMSKHRDTAIICFDPKFDTQYFYLKPPKHEAN